MVTRYVNPPLGGDLGCLSGTRYTISKLLAGIGYSVGGGLAWLVIVLLLRVVVRRQWAAITATVALVTVVPHVLFFSFGFELPVTLELSAWYGQPTVLFLVAVGALTFYGFYVSLAGRPMFGERFLEE